MNYEIIIFLYPNTLKGKKYEINLRFATRFYTRYYLAKPVHA